MVGSWFISFSNIYLVRFQGKPFVSFFWSVCRFFFRQWNFKILTLKDQTTGSVDGFLWWLEIYLTNLTKHGILTNRIILNHSRLQEHVKHLFKDTFPLNFLGSFPPALLEVSTFFGDNHLKPFLYKKCLVEPSWNNRAASHTCLTSRTLKSPLWVVVRNLH